VHSATTSRRFSRTRNVSGTMTRTTTVTNTSISTIVIVVGRHRDQYCGRSGRSTGATGGSESTVTIAIADITFATIAITIAITIVIIIIASIGTFAARRSVCRGTVQDRRLAADGQVYCVTTIATQIVTR
jgi:hypothetical protein